MNRIPKMLQSSLPVQRLRQEVCTVVRTEYLSQFPPRLTTTNHQVKTETYIETLAGLVNAAVRNYIVTFLYHLSCQSFNSASAGRAWCASTAHRRLKETSTGSN